MKRFFVKWTYTDDYGRPRDYSHYDWFETEKEAKDFVEWQEDHNGSWFYLRKLTEGNYNDFIRMQELEKEIERLQEIF